MVVMEDASRYSFVYFLRKKSDAFSKMKECLARVKNAKGLYPITILSDGGELNSTNMQEYCKELGIEYVTTAAKASNQNPLVERKIRTVREMCMAMLEQAGMPRQFWEEAVRHSVYLQNRLPHKALDYASPVLRWEGNGNNDHFDYVRIFGCKVVGYDTLAHKMSKDRGREGVYLGVSTDSKAYLCYDPVTQTPFTTV